MPVLESIITDGSNASASSDSPPQLSTQRTYSQEDYYRTQSHGEDAVPNHTGHIDSPNLEKQNTANSTSSRFNQRTQSVISRIRSREPGQVAKFTHPLSHTKTGPDVLVEFDGPDDQYHPQNWGFKKKSITTVLYGLTTMGMSLVQKT